MREFALLAARPDLLVRLPTRLRYVMAAVEQAYAEVSRDIADQRDASLDAGLDHLDLTVNLSSGASVAAARLDALLDEVDAYCAAGDHLLTEPPDPSVVAFRHWYFAEITRQLLGEAAVPWPGRGESAAATAVPPPR